MSSDSPKHRLAIIVGARPNFVKAAPLMRALRLRADRFETTLIHTGQHHDAAMSDVFFRELDIPTPDLHLACGGGDHVQTIAAVIRGVTTELNANAYDTVVVFGDVSSTVGTALAGAKQGCAVVHIEAGLRSHDRRMPEELNRVITDHLSDLLLISEPQARENLIAEGIDPERIHHVGNIMIDSLAGNLPRIEATKTVERLGLEAGAYILSTIHRQETTDDRILLERVFRALQQAAKTRPVVIPLHPRTKQKLEQFDLVHLTEGLQVVPPLGYLDFTNLLQNAYAVVTDSGGVQEESSWLNVPCITLRDNTERPVTITHGTNTLIPVFSGDLVEYVRLALEQPKRRTADIPFWDGNTAERILDILEKLPHSTTRPRSE